MRKICKFVFVVLVYVSCQTNKEKVELNLKKGEVYTQKTNSNVLINQMVEGQSMDINTAITGDISFKVLEIKDTVYDLEVKYEKIAMKMKMPSGDMNFNSEKKDTSDIFSSIMSTMIGEPFYMKISKRGKIIEIKNIENIFKNIYTRFPHLSEEQKKQLINQLMQSYGEKALKGSFEMVMAIYTNEKIGKGDVWKVQSKLESGMALKVETTYELVDNSSSFILIKGNSTVQSEDKNAYVNANGLLIKYDLNGTMVSDIKLDKNTGWIKEASFKQSVKGEAFIKENEVMPQGMKIPMQINNDTKIVE